MSGARYTITQARRACDAYVCNASLRDAGKTVGASGPEYWPPVSSGDEDAYRAAAEKWNNRSNV